VGLTAGVSAAQFDEYRVKSAFVLNFLQFVDWPGTRLPSGAPIAVCVMNDSPITARLREFAAQPVRGHQVDVRTVSALAEMVGCHVVFVPSASTARLPEVIARSGQAGVLVIAEDRDSAVAEASLHVAVVGNRVAFDVNLDRASAQGLKVSSRLVQLARRVVGGAAMGRPPAGGGR
jgi:hypothetical protein